MSRSEASIEKSVVEYAKKRGCLVRKMNGLGARHWPDRMFITPKGKVYFLEFKKPGNKPTPGQTAMLTELQEREMWATWTDSVAGGKDYVDLWFDLET